MNQWHNLAIEVDFLRDQYTFLVDGDVLGVQPFLAGFDSDVLLRGALVTYARPDGEGRFRSNFTYRFDNFAIITSPVPEPSSLFLLAMAAPVVLGYTIVRRRTRPCSISTESCPDTPGTL